MDPQAARPGPLALVGSGEYLPVMAGVEGTLVEGRPPRYVQIPTAAAPEGPRRLQYWLDLGAAQAERLGVEQVPVVVRDRDEAESGDLAALALAGCSAGAIALTDWVPAVRSPAGEPDRGPPVPGRRGAQHAAASAMSRRTRASGGQAAWPPSVTA